MIKLCQQSAVENEKIEILNNLCIDFKNRESKLQQSGRTRFSVMNHSLNSLREISSPDNKRKLIVAENNAGIHNQATSVSIHLKKQGEQYMLQAE